MSLNWDMTRVKDVEKLNENEEARTVSDILIWGCLTLDMGDITEKNIDEWLFRMTAFERCTGHALGIKNGKPWNPEREELVKRIGLTTNVCTKTHKQFLKRCLERLERYCSVKE